MTFQYAFETASCLILAIFLIDFIYRRQFPENTTRVFLPFILLSVFSSILSILLSYAINHPAIFSITIKNLLASLYYILQGVSYILMFIFIQTVSGPVYKKKWIPVGFYLLPGFIYVALAATSPFTSLFFHFNGQGFYRYGYADESAFFLVFIFSLIHGYHVLRYGDKNNEYARFMILLFCLTSLLLSSLQALVPQLMLTGLIRTICIATMYIALRNPNELLDKTTDLFNKTAFFMRIDEKKKHDEEFSIIYINMDKYRFINQNFGYENSTALLCDIAANIKRICPTNEIYRMDRDEFAIITSGHEELIFISAIKERFEKPWLVQHTTVMLKSRILVLRYPQHFINTTELSPMLLYMDQLAKKLGDGAIFIAREENVEAFRRHVYIEDAIKEAIRNKTLCAFFQPIHSSADGSLVAAEVLARIPDNRFGFIPTQEFIGIAEDNGFIVDLGYQMFEIACAFIKKMTEKGDAACIPVLEVNISAIQCLQPDLADKMISIAKRYDIRPSSINLEITETAAVQSDSLLKKHMERLHSYGFTFSIDDYGTGFANCSYLISYPFDQVKFDRGMILSYFNDDSAKIIIDNEFDSIHRLGKTIVAEGIENTDQAEVLAQKGIEYFQGHHFSKPLTEAEFISYLASNI